MDEAGLELGRPQCPGPPEGDVDGVGPVTRRRGELPVPAQRRRRGAAGRVDAVDGDTACALSRLGEVRDDPGEVVPVVRVRPCL
ncbi:Uncharacterised protein [Mycobacteroides abscessus subsp. abscessus]|nr:Uncharacterised protein [Mycobacteroides abscessus subsp. abscessus]